MPLQPILLIRRFLHRHLPQQHRRQQPRRRYPDHRLPHHPETVRERRAHLPAQRLGQRLEQRDRSVRETLRGFSSSTGAGVVGEDDTDELCGQTSRERVLQDSGGEGDAPRLRKRTQVGEEGDGRRGERHR